MGLPLIKHSSLFLLAMLHVVYTRGMCIWVEEELYAHEFYLWPGMLIDKGAEDVHARHVLQFAAVISCYVHDDKRFWNVHWKFPQDVPPCSLCPKQCCQLVKCMCCNSFTNSSICCTSSLVWAWEVLLKMYPSQVDFTDILFYCCKVSCRSSRLIPVVQK